VRGSARSDQAAAIPHSSAAAMEACPITTARPPRRRSAPGASSVPMPNMNKITSSWASTFSEGIAAAGNSQCCTSGSTAPSTVGPSSTPPASSPATAGCPILRATAPAPAASATTAVTATSARSTALVLATEATGPVARTSACVDRAASVPAAAMGTATSSA
jgi:hypothetical protein